MSIRTRRSDYPASKLNSLISSPISDDSGLPGKRSRSRLGLGMCKTGRERRIEIWFYRLGDEIYLSSQPAVRGWYANLLQHPQFTFHLKNFEYSLARTPPVVRLSTSAR
jgi:hypothetical protein